jgi:Protein of unknown function (DUF2384)
MRRQQFITKPDPIPRCLSPFGRYFATLSAWFARRQILPQYDIITPSLLPGSNTVSAPDKSNNHRAKEILDRALYLFAGNEMALQEWLHRPDPQLSGLTPQQVIDSGQPEAVAFIIEEALQGNPD